VEALGHERYRSNRVSGSPRGRFAGAFVALLVLDHAERAGRDPLAVLQWLVSPGDQSTTWTAA